MPSIDAADALPAPRRGAWARPLLLALALLVLAAGPSRADRGHPEGPPGSPGVPDEALQARIDAAIEKGAAWLREQQAVNGSIGEVTIQGQTHYEIGATALAGLALLAAGDSAGDEVVDKALAYCRRRDEVLGGAGSRTTYDASTLLMFVTAYHRPEEDESVHRGGTVSRSRANPCQLPPEARKWVQDLAMWLVRVRKPATATWGYPANRDDHSNTQYAYLGLRAARDCGVPVPPQIFLQGIKTMLARQQEDGPAVDRIIPGAGPDDSPYVIRAGDRARGFSYLPGMDSPTGSMTTAGIAILAICHDALVRPERFGPYDGKTERQVQQAVQDAFSWLQVNFAVTRNPGPGAPNWHHYYLYGLERAGVLGGRVLLGEHDWYVEGARHLVGSQHGDGRWSTGALGGAEYQPSDVLDTAWAVLFLARATRPAPPLQAPVVTEGD